MGLEVCNKFENENWNGYSKIRVWQIRAKLTKGRVYSFDKN